MKYIFFGTPEFAAIILGKLINTAYTPIAVICNPDEPVGRKKILISPPVKVLAEKFNLSVFQLKKLQDNQEFVKELKNLEPDLAIIAAYGKILPKEILDIPSHGFLNVHPSLLPKYRGASPIQYAILNGDSETGVTIMKIDEKMDHGPILAISKLQITNPKITYVELSQKLAELGADLLIKTIPDYIFRKLKSVEQDHSKATYTKIIKKEDGKINWSKNADEIERMTRGYYPWPSAWTNWNGKILKILETELLADFMKWPIGKVFFYNSNIIVKCGKGVLIIKKLQLEGGKILTAKEFINGHKNFIGSVLE